MVNWWVVNHGSAPPRIEIELTAHEGRVSRRDRKRPAPAPTSAPAPGVAVLPRPMDSEQPSGEPGKSPRTERNRLVLTALSAGAIALFVGWVLGRAGGSDGSAQSVDGTATTLARDDADDPATSAAGTDTLPEAELPTTTRPRRTTTTTLAPEWVGSNVTIDPRLAGATDRIVAVTDDGGLLELGLQTGLSLTLAPPRSRSASSLPPVAGDDWIAVMFDDGTPPQVYRSGATESITLNGSDPWSTYWQVDTDTFWALDFDLTGGYPTGLTERTIGGEPTGRSIDTRGMWPSAVDPAGGIIVGDAMAGMFTVTPDGSTRLPDGRPVSIGVAHVVVHSCTESIDTCGLSVVDRATGEVTSVPRNDELMNGLNRGGWWGPVPSRAMVTSDGQGALLSVIDETGYGRIGVLDVGTGDFTPLGSVRGNYPSAAWSADERFVFIVVDGSITAYDRTTRETFPVVLDGGLDRVRSLTTRPAG